MRRTILYITALAAIGSVIAAQTGRPQTDVQRIPVPTAAPATVDSVVPADTLDLSGRNDSIKSLPVDTTRQRLSRINREQADLETSVTFDATDSLLMIGQNNTYLYGNAKVEYGNFKLNAQEIRMELDKSTVYAVGAPDSTGQIVGNPVFQDGGDEYESKEMSYNFKTQRGYITDVITEQGEGYLTGGASKKMEDGSFFIQYGKYTTCEDH